MRVALWLVAGLVGLFIVAATWPWSDETQRWIAVLIFGLFAIKCINDREDATTRHRQEVIRRLGSLERDIRQVQTRLEIQQHLAERRPSVR